MSRSRHKQTLSKAMIGVLLMTAVTDLQLIAAIAPGIATGLQTSVVEISYSFVVYSISAAAVATLLVRSPTYFRWADMLPAMCVLYGGMIWLSLASSNVLFFLAARAVCGIAGGVISALAITALAKATIYEKRGASMNFVAFGYFAAPMLGVPLGVFLADRFDWYVPVGVLGIVFPAIGVMLWLFPLKNGHTGTTTPRSDRGDMAFAKSRRMGVISAFFVSSGVIGFMTFVGSWIADLSQPGALNVGTVYLLINLAGLIGGLFGGFLADRFGKKQICLYPTFLMAICLFGVLIVSTPAAILAFLLGASATAALRVAPLQAILTELAAPNDISRYIAARNISSQLGIAFSVIICGRLYAAFGFDAVLVTCAALTLVAWITINGIVDPDAPVATADQKGIVTSVAFEP